MSTEKNQNGDAENPKRQPSAGRAENTVEIQCRGKVTVKTTETPPPAPAGKKIHRRRPLPPVADKGSS